MPLRASRLQVAKAARIASWQRRRAEIEAHTRIGLETLTALQHGLAGTLVIVGDPEYDQARQLAGPTFQGLPVAIAECKTATDVRLALLAARRARWSITCKSGGHSIAGFSVNDGLVIDLCGLSYVRVDPQNVFRFEQSVAPRLPGAQPHATVTSRFSDPEITYRYRVDTT